MRPVIIFAGTTEGRKLSEYLAVRKVPVTACVATEYGETLLTETEYLKVHAGRMDEAAMGQFFEEQKTELVVDATHPYAAVVSENVAAACKKAGVEYLRLIRESSTSETEDAVLVDSVDEAVNFLKETEGNILATTGSKELFKYTVIPNYESRVFARVIGYNTYFNNARSVDYKPILERFYLFGNYEENKKYPELSYLIPAKTVTAGNSYVKSLVKNGITGAAPLSVGNSPYSSADGKGCDLTSVMQNYIKILEDMRNKQINVLLKSPAAYAIPYAKYLYSLPLRSRQ